MAQIDCPNCGNMDAKEYFYYMSCNNCGYEECIEPHEEQDDDY